MRTNQGFELDEVYWYGCVMVENTPDINVAGVRLKKEKRFVLWRN